MDKSTDEAMMKLISIWKSNDGDEYTQNIIYAILEALGEEKRFNEYCTKANRETACYEAKCRVEGYTYVTVYGRTKEEAMLAAEVKLKANPMLDEQWVCAFSCKKK